MNERTYRDCLCKVVEKYIENQGKPVLRGVVFVSFVTSVTSVDGQSDRSCGRELELPK